MSKKSRRNKAVQPPPKALAQGMSIDAILAQLSRIKESHRLAVGLNPDAEQIWKDNAAACEAATDILTVLQDEGIRDPEQVRDLIHDYHALSWQYQKMHQQYEEPVQAKRLGTACLCPECSRQVRFGNAYCWNCGKPLSWGR